MASIYVSGCKTHINLQYNEPHSIGVFVKNNKTFIFLEILERFILPLYWTFFIWFVSLPSGACVNESEAAEYSTLYPACNRSVQSHLSSPVQKKFDTICKWSIYVSKSEN